MKVPTVNVQALYDNSTAGKVISPTIFDAAMQDVVMAIDSTDTELKNYQAGTRYTVDGGAFTDTAFVNTIDGGTFV